MKLLRPIHSLLLAFALAMSAHAAERGTKEEAKAMVDRAVDHIQKAGAAQAYKDFQNDKANWVQKDLYVFVVDMQGVVVTHGANEKLVGKNMTEIKDPSGKFFIQEMIGVAKGKGAGWVDYEWVHPASKKIEGKTSYVRKLPSGDGLIAVGVYR